MRTLALALCSACGACDPETASPDATIRDDGMVRADAAAPDARVPTCAASTFTTFSGIPALNSPADETFLRFSPDELTAYFVLKEMGVEEAVYTSTRVSLTAPFTPPVKLPINGNGTLETASPTVTGDGLTLYFTSNRPGTMGLRDIWRATRTATNLNFANIVAVAELNSPVGEPDVYVLPDHSAIYFSSDRNAGITRIYRAERQGAVFLPPEEVFSEAPSSIARVVVAPNERTMLYTIDNNLRLSIRDSTTVSWQPGVELPALESTGIDHPTWISPDLCRMYFHSDRATTNTQLFAVVRSPQ